MPKRRKNSKKRESSSTGNLSETMIIKAGHAIYGGLTISKEHLALKQKPATEEAGRLTPQVSSASSPDPVDATTNTIATEASNCQIPNRKSGCQNNNGKSVLIRGAIPDEIVAITTIEKNGYFLGNVTGTIEPSPDRTVPSCNYFNACGGCHYQFMIYKKQVELKLDILADCLRRIGGIDVELDDPLIDNSNTWSYRYRGRFKIFGNRVGFNREKSNKVVEIEACPLMMENINNGLSQIRNIMEENRYLFKDIDELSLVYGNGLYAAAKTNSRITNRDQKFRNILEHLNATGLIGSKVYDDYGKSIDLGRKYPVLDLGDLKYSVSTDGFFQANWKLNQSLIRTVVRQCEAFNPTHVLDLYSGAGNFSLPIAEKTGFVTAIEENSTAAQAGSRNAELNLISNIRFINMPVENVHDELFSTADVVIADPPRSGISKSVVDKILNNSPRAIIYVSCDPSTLARDLKVLSKQYHIGLIRLVDMFPQTYHVETLAILHV
ncbi:MAG: 23S rRNA (uracil(1939)-C(5))-methyltransferase RlmD [Rubrobacteridae bacterium]|nr:23S rRNA (uracil(1939)-C(5))-methyltransferase RlmD [Rubrobacteridae bacterium]